MQTPAHPGRGPKPVAYSDAIFAMGMKVFGGLSARRSTTDIETCAEDGHMSKALRYNTVVDCFNNAALTRSAGGPKVCPSRTPPEVLRGQK